MWSRSFTTFKKIQICVGFAHKLPIHQRSLLTLDLAITATCRDSDIRNVRALVVGPPDTPYEFGFFEVGHGGF